MKSYNKITIKKYIYDPNDTPFITKQKKKLNKLVDEKLEKITDSDEKVNHDDLIYRFKDKIADIKFDEFDMLLVLLIKYEMVKKTYLR